MVDSKEDYKFDLGVKGLRYLRFSVKSDFRFGSFKRKLTTIPFVYNLMIRYPKMDRLRKLSERGI